MACDGGGKDMDVIVIGQEQALFQPGLGADAGIGEHIFGAGDGGEGLRDDSVHRRLAEARHLLGVERRVKYGASLMPSHTSSISHLVAVMLLETRRLESGSFHAMRAPRPKDGPNSNVPANGIECSVETDIAL